MNFANFYYALGAFLAGALIPIQTGYNTQLSRAMHGPIISALAVYAIGLLAILGATLAFRTPFPSQEQIAAAPPASWFAGGILSALYIFALITIAPRLGAASTVAFVVLGQIACSVVIDHFGLLGFATREASPLRLLGLAVMAAGVALMRFS